MKITFAGVVWRGDGRPECHPSRQLCEIRRTRVMSTDLRNECSWSQNWPTSCVMHGEWNYGARQRLDAGGSRRGMWIASSARLDHPPGINQNYVRWRRRRRRFEVIIDQLRWRCAQPSAMYNAKCRRRRPLIDIRLLNQLPLHLPTRSLSRVQTITIATKRMATAASQTQYGPRLELVSRPDIRKPRDTPHTETVLWILWTHPIHLRSK